MTDRKRTVSTFGRTALLSLAALLATMLGAEVAFRMLLFSDLSITKKLRNPYLYADYLSDDKFYKLRYAFNAGPPPARTDPLLGWVGRFAPETYEHERAPELRARRAVLLYGDSFAACAGEVTCFETFLNADPVFASGHYLLNYGVAGYGVDQIYLSMVHSLRHYEDPFIIVAIMVEDLDRSVLRVREGPKPYFELTDGELVLRGTPVPLDGHTFFAEHPPKIISYLYRFLLRHPAVPWRVRAYLQDDRDTRRAKEMISARIVRTMVNELQRRKLRHLFLVFFPEWYFFTVDDDWREMLLRRLLEATETPTIFAKEIVRKDAAERKRPYSDYFLPNSHPNSEQYRLLAEVIRTHILSRSAGGAPPK